MKLKEIAHRIAMLCFPVEGMLLVIVRVEQFNLYIHANLPYSSDLYEFTIDDLQAIRELLLLRDNRYLNLSSRFGYSGVRFAALRDIGIEIEQEAQ